MEGVDRPSGKFETDRRLITSVSVALLILAFSPSVYFHTAPFSLLCVSTEHRAHQEDEDKGPSPTFPSLLTLNCRLGVSFTDKRNTAVENSERWVSVSLLAETKTIIPS